MKQAKAALACTLLLVLTGPVTRPRDAVDRQRHAEKDDPERAALGQLRQTGNQLFRGGRYLEASRIFERGYREAIGLGDQPSALRFLVNLGGCRFARFQYRPAMQAYLEGRRLAHLTGDWEALASISSNISSLYLQFGELDASIEAAESAMKTLRRAGPTRHMAKLLLQSAVLRAQRGQMEAALEMFQQALEEADRQGDLPTLAFAWDSLGYELLRRRQFAAAEHALLEAFRLRKLRRLPDVEYSYYTLGMLRLEQGDVRSASRLLDEAVRRAVGGSGALPLWRVYYERGRARMVQGRLEDALADFQTSLDYARRWRVELLTADSVWSKTTVDLQKAYSVFIEAANQLYFKTGNLSFARAAFQAADENRAVSLRARLDEPVEYRRRLPPEYWQTLAQLRAAEVDLLRRDTPDTREQISLFRSRVARMETEVGLNLPALFPAGGETNLLSRTTRSLRPDEAFLSFHLGDTESCLYATTRSKFRLYRLPPRDRIASRVKRFREAVREGAPDGVLLGEQIYTDLFGQLDADATGRSRWLLALDGVLFELPFAALVAGRESDRPVFLIERHSIHLTPAASMVTAGSPARWAGPFLGVGDAVYNTADPRWSGGNPTTPARGGILRILPRLLADSTAVPPLQMPRLPASGREIRICARTWEDAPAGAVLLQGTEASRHRLGEALRQRPSIVHFATHFLASKTHPRQALVALSLGPADEVEFLSPTEISRYSPLRTDLVVLSGCSSGVATTLQGEGLMGMCRAWLAAGAGSVAASLWPTPDDSGELFVSFYRHLRDMKRHGQRRLAATALREAQLDMLRSGTWRSSPGYWAAYFIIGRE